MSDIKLACDVAEQIKTICDKHGNNPGELINILHEAQHLQGYLPEEIQRIIASKLEIPVSKVYGVVTFYTFFTMTPKGKHPISVCMGQPAMYAVPKSCWKNSNECWVSKSVKQLRTENSHWTACAVWVPADWRR